MVENSAKTGYDKTMVVNTKYKDSLFSSIFSDPDTLRELYCALEGVTLPKDIPVTINTLQDVLFMDKVNDISFEIGGKIVVLIEHQSTINPNMALRLLMYIARVYEKITGDKKKHIYSAKQLTLPRPEFFVLYNGTASYPDEATLKLSDVFESAEALGISAKGAPALELVVRVLNINEGRNAGIAERCMPLAGYSSFVAKVREYGGGGLSKEEAVKKAVMYCLDHGIMRGYLETHATEVINMLTAEWNWEDAKQVWQEEAREEGREEGLERVARNALAEGVPIAVIEKITGLSYEVIEKIYTGV
jgi:hypothetical protein